jgi:hypothetical protein
VVYALTRLVRGLASDTVGDAFHDALVLVLRQFTRGAGGGGGGGGGDAKKQTGLQTERAAGKGEVGGGGERESDTLAADHAELPLFGAARVFDLMDRYLDYRAGGGGGGGGGGAGKGEALSAKERGNIAHGSLRAISALWQADSPTGSWAASSRAASATPGAPGPRYLLGNVSATLEV